MFTKHPSCEWRFACGVVGGGAARYSEARRVLHPPKMPRASPGIPAVVSFFGGSNSFCSSFNTRAAAKNKHQTPMHAGSPHHLGFRRELPSVSVEVRASTTPLKDVCRSFYGKSGNGTYETPMPRRSITYRSREMKKKKELLCPVPQARFIVAHDHTKLFGIDPYACNHMRYCTPQLRQAARCPTGKWRLWRFRRMTRARSFHQERR